MNAFEGVLSLVSLSDPLLVGCLRLWITATVAISVAFALVLVFKRRSAAQRHRILVLGLVGALIAPILIAIELPSVFAIPTGLNQETSQQVAEPSFTKSVEQPSRSVRPQTAPAERHQDDEAQISDAVGVTQPSSQAGVSAELPPAIEGEVARRATTPSAIGIGQALQSALPYIIVVWVVGSIIAISNLGFRWRQGKLLIQRSVRINDSQLNLQLERVCREQRLKQIPILTCSQEVDVPVTLGWLRPVVVLPIGYGHWAMEKLRLVLTHEVIHVRRRDVLCQYIAEAANAVYWFHPIVWLVSRRLRIEREYACDDAIIGDNVSATSYAEQLINIAASLRSDGSIPKVASAMVSKAKLNQRLSYMLDVRVRREEVGATTSQIQFIAMVLLVMLFAFSTPTFQLNRATAADADSPIAVQDDATEIVHDTKNELYAGRFEKRDDLLEQYGGTAETELAVSRGLEWIAQQQLPDGSWDFRTSLEDPTIERPDQRVAATSMALMAFVGAGQTHQTGRFQEIVHEGISWLLENQVVSGEFRGQSLYTHALAMHALVEAYGITQDERILDAAQRSVDFAVSAQDPVGGGWRYRPRQPGDTSVTGWFVSGLSIAKESSLDVPDSTFELIKVYLDNAQSDGGTAYPYIAAGGITSGMTAVGHLCRQWTARDREFPGMDDGLRWLASERGFDMGEPDFYYWFHASQVFRNYGGALWEEWNGPMREQLVLAQGLEGNETGSWSPESAKWGAIQGRLYTTCMAVLILEVYYRHTPPFE